LARSYTVLIFVLSLSLALNAYLLLGKRVDFVEGGGWALGPLAGAENTRQFDEEAIYQADLLTEAGVEIESEIEELHRLVAEDNFDAAVRIYQSLGASQRLVSQAQAQQIKLDLTALLIQWLETNELSRAEQLINAFLNQSPYDIEFRELEAQWLLSNGAFIEAIDKYYILLGESDPQAQGVYIASIHEIVQQRIEVLSENKAWQPLADFIQRLIWHEPQHSPFVLALAKTYIELEQYARAKTELYAIQYDSNYGGRVEELLELISLRELQAVSIPLTPQRQHYVVAGEIEGSHGVKLMIDTGASLSVLSEKFFQSLKSITAAELIRYSNINTAGGLVRAPIYRFDSFQIGEYIIRDALFVVMDLNESDGNQGLLGMSYLQNFNFQIDQKNSLLLLSPRK
jgi:clan AA aspartic protease (TIGR02281 family)